MMPTTTEHVQSLERGLAVIRAFTGARPAMTVADAAKVTGLTRATARRILHTLCTLGYVASDGKTYTLTPLVLDLGHAYVSSLQLPDIAMPYMESLSASVHESVSAAVLEGTEVVYVARVPTQRIMAVALSIGSRLPAAWTSLGRVLLSGLDDHKLDQVLEKIRFDEAPTGSSVRSPEALRASLDLVRRQGWALLDQELERGVRSISAPLHDRRGSIVAAINVGTPAGRVSIEQLTSTILPELLATASAIDAHLAKR